MVGQIETVKIGGTNTRYFSTGVSNLVLMCIFRHPLGADLGCAGITAEAESVLKSTL